MCLKTEGAAYLLGCKLTLLYLLFIFTRVALCWHRGQKERWN